MSSSNKLTRARNFKRLWSPEIDSKERIPPEPVFLNVYGAPQSIPRDEFRQPI